MQKIFLGYLVIYEYVYNSRIASDASVGKFTCFMHNGESVFDYLRASYNYFDIMNFCVQDFTELSNHVPLIFDLDTNTKLFVHAIHAESYNVKWDNNYIDMF